MKTTELPVIQIEGSALQCGKQYGRTLRIPISGFFEHEIFRSRKHLLFAKRCWVKIKQYAPTSADFIRGIVKGAYLSIEEVVLLNLHEELVHDEHCTLIASPGIGRHKQPLNAENWDWPRNKYPWAGILRMKIKGCPKLLAYHYPGLWSCCGVNSAGFSLMWSGAGYLPVVKSKVGIPTYILVFELLLRKSTKDAVSFLRQIPNAGCFIISLVDKKGNSTLVEGVPGQLCFTSGNNQILHRANHYESPEIIKASKQKLPNYPIHSTERTRALRKVLPRLPREIGISEVQKALLHPKVFVQAPNKSQTIDSIIADCRSKSLHYRRGGSEKSNNWKKITL